MSEDKTKKVVVSKCYGGFGLSRVAEVEYAKKKGFKIFFYARVSSGSIRDYYRTSIDDPNLDKMLIYYTLKRDMGEQLNTKNIPDSEYDEIVFSSRDIPRDDPDLVAVVEGLGSEAASGWAARLEVVEIPNDVEYHIDDYDGWESIHENHRSW